MGSQAIGSRDRKNSESESRRPRDATPKPFASGWVCQGNAKQARNSKKALSASVGQALSAPRRPERLPYNKFGFRIFGLRFLDSARNDIHRSQLNSELDVERSSFAWLRRTSERLPRGSICGRGSGVERLLKGSVSDFEFSSQMRFSCRGALGRRPRRVGCCYSYTRLRSVVWRVYTAHNPACGRH
jgi:hypothetical protein